jgi:opacity protein-like surface antigen
MKNNIWKLSFITGLLTVNAYGMYFGTGMEFGTGTQERIYQEKNRWSSGYVPAHTDETNYNVIGQSIKIGTGGKDNWYKAELTLTKIDTKWSSGAKFNENKGSLDGESFYWLGGNIMWSFFKGSFQPYIGVGLDLFATANHKSGEKSYSYTSEDDSENDKGVGLTLLYGTSYYIDKNFELNLGIRKYSIGWGSAKDPDMSDTIQTTHIGLNYHF